MRPTSSSSGRGYARKDWDAVSDNPELADRELALAKPFGEVFPDLAASARRRRGPQKAPTKELVTLRLDRVALAAFRATGPGWRRHIDEAAKKAASKIARRTSRLSPANPDRKRQASRPGAPLAMVGEVCYQTLAAEGRRRRDFDPGEQAATRLAHIRAVGERSQS